MTRCNGQPVAKISDEPSKTMDYDPSYVALPARGVPGARDAGAAGERRPERGRRTVGVPRRRRRRGVAVAAWPSSASPCKPSGAAPSRDAAARRQRAAAKRGRRTARLRLDDILTLHGRRRAGRRRRCRARSRRSRTSSTSIRSSSSPSRSGSRPSAPHRLLTLEWLVEWLAGKLGVPYLHIDPLKIDLAAVTQTMSNAYAERFRILPVAVDRATLTVATASRSCASGPTSSRRSSSAR